MGERQHAFALNDRRTNQMHVVMSQKLDSAFNVLHSTKQIKSKCI